MGNGGEAMTTYIHYRVSDGAIFGWEHGVVAPSCQPGLACALIDDVVTPDPRRQRFHPLFGLVDKTDDASGSTIDDIRRRIARELTASDQFMMPDRPMTKELRDAWIIYRQALRDLSKLPTPADQLAAWPISPNVDNKQLES